MSDYKDAAVRATAIASVLKSIDITDDEMEDLRLLYENTEGFPYDVDSQNRPQGPTIPTSRNVGSRIKRALNAKWGYGMNWVGKGDPHRNNWFMNEAFRSAVDQVGLFPRVEVDGASLARDDFESKVARALSDTTAARMARLQNADQTSRRIQVTTYVYDRNADVVAQALIRANGVCEGCGAIAPFFKRRDGQPYLEVHHKISLANGGKDSLSNAVALCPNCHRKSHYG